MMRALFLNPEGRFQSSDALSRPAAAVSTAGDDLPIAEMDDIDSCMIKEYMTGSAMITKMEEGG